MFSSWKENWNCLDIEILMSSAGQWARPAQYVNPVRLMRQNPTCRCGWGCQYGQISLFRLHQAASVMISIPHASSLNTNNSRTLGSIRGCSISVPASALLMYTIPHYCNPSEDYYHFDFRWPCTVSCFGALNNQSLCVITKVFESCEINALACYENI